MTNISNRLRFEVLRRDNFTCRYCGAKAPDVKLNVDAVVPEALGGSHKDPTNLVAACENCNNGKSSTSPDAPVVASVAEDALRWAQAIRQAQAQMLADLDALKVNRQQFAEWWDAWGYGAGEERQSIPKPSGWTATVDQFIAAGLPLAALEECIDQAMSRQKVVPSQTFRYMCGVAWKKIAALQEAAREIAATGNGGGADDWERDIESVEIGRSEIAAALLREGLSSPEMEWYVRDALDNPGRDDQSAYEVAVHRAFVAAVTHKRFLLRAVEQVLAVADGGTAALDRARTQRLDYPDTPAAETELLCLATRILAPSEPLRIGELV